jgi:epoxyqueuosine reductase
MDSAHWRQQLEAQAYGLGFDLVGCTTLGTVESWPAFREWLDAGRHGTMDYLERGAELRRDSRLPHSGATHAIVVAMHYGGRTPSGPVARYARGDDYHEIMRERLRGLHHWLERAFDRSIDARPYVDSGPMLERDLARRAGLGWFGKNTMLISPRLGSFFFLGALVVDVALPIDAPFEADRCGSCTRCLDACPTEAFSAPRVLDATRCISYLTIEHRGPIDAALAPLIGDWLYGCDVCQDVCPWNRKFSRELAIAEFAARPAVSGKDARSLATELLAMSPDEFASSFKDSAIKRAKLRGLKRNAAVVLGNLGSSGDGAALVAAMSDAEPLVRSQAAESLGRSGDASALNALEARLAIETEADVLAALRAAFERLTRSAAGSSK